MKICYHVCLKAKLLLGSTANCVVLPSCRWHNVSLLTGLCANPRLSGQESRETPLQRARENGWVLWANVPWTWFFHSRADRSACSMFYLWSLWRTFQFTPVWTSTLFCWSRSSFLQWVCRNMPLFSTSVVFWVLCVGELSPIENTLGSQVLFEYIAWYFRH